MSQLHTETAHHSLTCYKCAHPKSFKGVCQLRLKSLCLSQLPAADLYSYSRLSLLGLRSSSQDSIHTHEKSSSYASAHVANTTNNIRHVIQLKYILFSPSPTTDLYTNLSLPLHTLRLSSHCFRHTHKQPTSHHLLTMHTLEMASSISAISSLFVSLGRPQHSCTYTHHSLPKPYVSPHTASAILLYSSPATHMLTMYALQTTPNTSAAASLFVSFIRQEQTCTHTYFFLSTANASLHHVPNTLINSPPATYVLTIGTPQTTAHMPGS